MQPADRILDEDHAYAFRVLRHLSELDHVLHGARPFSQRQKMCSAAALHIFAALEVRRVVASLHTLGRVVDELNPDSLRLDGGRSEFGDHDDLLAQKLGGV